MTQEQKDLLLKDLCARLPYGVKCEVIKHSIDGEMLFIRNGSVALELTINNFKELVTNNLYEIKPYLFPLSSMNEEQKEEYYGTFSLSGDISGSVDFYNKHHLDWRGLIQIDLAIDATGLNIY
jgi:hypothetical protein